MRLTMIDATSRDQGRPRGMGGGAMKGLSKMARFSTATPLSSSTAAGKQLCKIAGVSSFMQKLILHF